MDYKQFVEAVANDDLRLSYSSLKNLLDSPKHFLDYFTKEHTATEAMQKGTLVHCLVLERTEFKNRYVVAQKPDLRTKAGKEEWAAILAESEGKTLISTSLYFEAEEMANAVKSHSEYALFAGVKEYEKPFVIEYRGRKIQGIVDALGDGVIVDLKTTFNAAPKKFKWSFLDFRYHLQAAIYTMAYPERPYYIFAVDGNNNVSVHQVSEETLEIGRQLLDEALDQYETLVFSESWEASYEGINLL